MFSDKVRKVLTNFIKLTSKKFFNVFFSILPVRFRSISLNIFAGVNPSSYNCVYLTFLSEVGLVERDSIFSASGSYGLLLKNVIFITHLEETP